MSFKTNNILFIDLLGEGEMRLKNGLASIFLDKTPIANSNVQNLLINKRFSGTVSGSDLNFTYDQDYNVGSVRPIRIEKGYAVSTVDTVAQVASVTTSSAFFDSSMIASGTPAEGGLWQWVRIPGAGYGGFDYVGQVYTVSSTTVGELNPAPQVTLTGAEITFDHYTYGTFDLTGVQLEVACPRTGTFNIDVGSASLESGAGSKGSVLNFKTAKVSFRPGTLLQPPVVNMPGFTNASYGRTIGTEIKQHDDYYAQKLTFPGIKDAAHSYNSSGAATEAASDTDLPVTADRIVLTISTTGQEAIKPTNQEVAGVGITLQIWFDYKTNSGDWAEQLIYGPTDVEIAAAKAYVWNGEQNPFTTTTGDIVGHDPEGGDHEFSFNIEQYQPFTQFKVRIKRITPVNYTMGSYTYTNGTLLKSVQGFIEDKLSYPHSAYCAMMIDSNEFQGKIPERAYECFGIPCWVPTNYITRAESNTGIAKYTRDGTGEDSGNYVPWNGEFRKVYCDNPVWALRTLILENRFGLGNWVSLDSINSYSFYAMARRCDDLVPDGNGGLEPRFICGVYLTQATEAYKIIKDFCSIMIAVPFWIDGQLLLESDRPQEPIYTFTKGNIIGGVFSYESTGNKTRPNQIAVTFNNKDNFSQPEVELVDDIDDILVKGRVFTEDCVAFGATSRGQAIRYAKWKLLTSKLNKEIVNFKTGENAAFIRPGNVVRIQDADRYRIRNSGRLPTSASTTTTTVIIDKGITIGTGDYDLHVLVEGSVAYLAQDSATIDSVDYVKGDILPTSTEEEASTLVDDSEESVLVTWSPGMHLETRRLTNTPAAGVTSLTVSTAFSSVPVADMVWAITNSIEGAIVEGSSKLFRILGISEDGPNVYSISASEHFNEKFDQIDENYLAGTAQTIPFNETVPSITNFTGAVAYRTSGVDSPDIITTRISSDVVLRWVPPQTASINSTTIAYPNLSHYVLKYNTVLGELKTITISKTSTNYRVENLPNGVYEFSLQAKGITGSISTPIFVTILVRDQKDIPGTVNQLGIPRGGRFSTAPILDGTTIRIIDDYEFVSASGTTVDIVGGAKV